MCLGIPGEVVEVGAAGRADLAKVDVSGARRVVNIGLLDEGTVRPGDWVLIHVGFALSKLDEEEARLTLSYLEQIGQVYQDELGALVQSQIE